MPIEFSSHRDGVYVRLTGHGRISDDDLIDAVELMYADDEATKRHQCALIDFSQVEHLELSSKAVRRAAQLNIAAAKLVSPGAAVALAAPDIHGFGLGRMWEAYADRAQWATRVFVDLKEAENWLEQRLNSTASGHC